jgi:hypothetical protein
MGANSAFAATLKRFRMLTDNGVELAAPRSSARARAAEFTGSAYGFNVAATLRTSSGVRSPASGVPGMRYLPIARPPTRTGS